MSSDRTPRSNRSWDYASNSSSFTTPSPPYGLTDATQRPGSLRYGYDYDASRGSGSGGQHTAPLPPTLSAAPSPARHVLRVGSLSIRCTHPFSPTDDDFKLHEIPSHEQSYLPLALRPLVADLENVIIRGHGLLISLRPFHAAAPDTQTALFWQRLRTLGELCMACGAGLCRYEGDVPRHDVGILAQVVAFVDEALKHASARMGTLGLMGGGTGQNQTAAVEAFAQVMNAQIGSGIDTAAAKLTHYTFLLMLAPDME